MSTSFIFTSESVSEGHPDKICDQVSDAIVDAFLEASPNARTAIEALATTNRLIIAGETYGPKHIDAEAMEHIARETIRQIGYEQKGFHWKNLSVDVLVHEQSPDISQGIDRDLADIHEEGAGDQGIMFGYACDDTDMLMPAPIYYAHSLQKCIAKARHDGNLPQIGPDGKCQLSVQYENNKPVGLSSIVLSAQHIENITPEKVRNLLMPYIEETLPNSWIPSKEHIHINPTGKFTIGGPDGDTGLTGRKITVDTYGGSVPHGGGSFSGKDPSKVDRSGAYAMRYLAKNIVAAGLAKKCTLQVAYTIGQAKPQSLYLNTHGTQTVPELEILAALPKVMNLTPRGIRDHLVLDRPIYKRTASYGHFGRMPDKTGGFTWEKLTLVTALKEILGLSS